MAFFKRSDDKDNKTPEQDSSAANHQEEYEGDRLAETRKALEEASLPEHALQAAYKELERLEKTDPAGAEFGIGLNYIDFILALPWNTAGEDNLDINRAARILNEAHAGMEMVKDRVLEHLAVSIRIGSKPHRVLVVDDEAVALENMAHILGREGYDIETASSGQQALEMLEARTYELVVSDLKMDKLDGMQLLEETRRISPATRFVIITGYATVDTAVEAMRKGAVHFLAKPIDLTRLRTVTAEILAGVRRRRLAPRTVLCFSGPPGTGKTSVGKAIARALGRSFTRLSMAGLRDESELRGHRRTYVGALPGRVLSEIRRCGVNNPVFMLDELDKVGQDFRGDPASILLEVLDPEQNVEFLDYYLDIPFDLSGTLFLATANIVERLSRPLLDRMEIIEFPAYTPSEKRSIALEHLLPRQRERQGLGSDELVLTPEAVDRLVYGYTREAGVRGLEREIASVCRKVSRRLLTSPDKAPRIVGPDEVTELLGRAPENHEAAMGRDLVGVATAMVWTEFGGEVLFVETASMEGKGDLIMTGSLGDVLKESARTALSHIRSRAHDLGLDPGLFAECDIHVHIPAGATPKDGPSAGVTIAAALVSLLTNRPARRNTALSGELTLSGRILPVGGLRMKLLAAAQAGAVRAVVPKANLPDIDDLEDEVRNALEIRTARDLQEVLDQVLLPPKEENKG